MERLKTEKIRENMKPLEAEVLDSCHLKLAKPIQIPPGSNILISIELPDGDSERASWLILSEQGLEIAYSESEPEYPTTMIKEPNPEYKP